MVRLDVVVTDPDGKVVRELAASDFEVREDGKPQRILHFVLGARSATGVLPTPGLGAPTEAPAAAGLGRHIVIVFDDLHISESSLPYARDALGRFVREFTSDEDSVALLATSAGGVLQQLTRDRASLDQAVRSLTSRDASVGRGRGGHAECGRGRAGHARPVRRHPARGEHADGRPGHRRGGAHGPTLVGRGRTSSSAQTGPGSVGDIASLNQREFYEKEAQRLAAPVLAEALHFSSATLSTLDQVLRQLSGAPGRKICLLVSDGFYLGRGTDQDRTRDLQRVIDAATRSGAVVYTLDARGLAGAEWREASTRSVDAPPGLVQSVGAQAQQLKAESLAALADGTGGFLVKGSNDLDRGLKRVLSDNEAYFLLAYEPTNTKRDGRFRKIDVRLPSHPTLTVRSRKGYLAPDDKAPQRPPAASSIYLFDESEARAALDSVPPAGGTEVELATAFVDLPPAGPQAIVSAHVGLDRLEWRKAGKVEHSTLEILGGLYDAAGAPVGSTFGKRADLDLAPDAAKRARASGLEYQYAIPLRPGTYEVRLLARDGLRRTLGGGRERIEVPDLAGKKLALSSVFLSSSSPAAPAAGAQGDVPGARPCKARSRGGASSRVTSSTSWCTSTTPWPTRAGRPTSCSRPSSEPGARRWPRRSRCPSCSRKRMAPPCPRRTE